jgi:predicted MPP superfamily phosphohydrolase
MAAKITDFFDVCKRECNILCFSHQIVDNPNNLCLFCYPNRNNMVIFWIFSIILLDIVAFRGIGFVFPKFGMRRRHGLKIVFVVQLVCALTIIIGGFFLQRHTHNYRLIAVYYYLFGLLLLLYVPKMLFALSLALEIVIWKHRKKSRYSRNSPRRLVAKLGLVMGAVFIGFFIWGVFWERFHYRISPIEIEIAELPEKFDGFKIVQISDLHAGSAFGNVHRFQESIDLVNQQCPDIIVFTGDFVNNFAEEMVPFIPMFSCLEAAAGKFAVMGNHDYGGYYDWASPVDSVRNQQAIEQNAARMGFDLLKNRAVVIEKDSANRIALVGVENWGNRKRRPKLGDIAMATGFVRDIPCKILLSHDPSFWDEKIKGQTDILLTLSGHTHGAQVGLRLGKYRISPSQLMFRRAIGLYRSGRQYMYVNSGLGVIGFPGRPGMSPEITVIELKKSNRL